MESNLLLNRKKINYNDFHRHITADEIRTARRIFTNWNKQCETSVKESSWKSKFLDDIFVKILGYKCEAGRNDNSLSKEYHGYGNIQVDAILGFNFDRNIPEYKSKNKIHAVIEMKSSGINIRLEQNIDQAFFYSQNVGSNVEWVILSNFKKFHIYKVPDRNKYLEFNMSELSKNNDEMMLFIYLMKKGNFFTKQRNDSKFHTQLSLHNTYEDDESTDEDDDDDESNNSDEDDKNNDNDSKNPKICRNKKCKMALTNICYECKNCPGYVLCQTCIKSASDLHKEKHTYRKMKKWWVQTNTQSKVEFRNEFCDSCYKDIKGVCFKSINTRDYDLCENCYKRRDPFRLLLFKEMKEKWIVENEETTSNTSGYLSSATVDCLSILDLLAKPPRSSINYGLPYW